MPTASAQAFDLGITEFITPVDGLVYPTGSYEIEFSVTNFGPSSWSNTNSRELWVYLCKFDVSECNDTNDDAKWERELPSLMSNGGKTNIGLPSGTFANMNLSLIHI